MWLGVLALLSACMAPGSLEDERSQDAIVAATEELAPNCNKCDVGNPACAGVTNGSTYWCVGINTQCGAVCNQGEGGCSPLNTNATCGTATNPDTMAVEQMTCKALSASVMTAKFGFATPPRGVCLPPRCFDNVRNFGETGIDCGGTSGCGSCAPSCTDGIQNGTETGVDCGGSCAACVANQCTGAPNGSQYYCVNSFPQCGLLCDQGEGGCTADAQCGTTTNPDTMAVEPMTCRGIPAGQIVPKWGFVGVTRINLCLPARCYDNTQNFGETGVDCGGTSGCGACVGSCTDAIQNGTETGVDCGGSCPTACPVQANGASTGQAQGRGIAIDGSNNVYVGGYFTNALSFGGSCGTITAMRGVDSFVAKFNPAGVCQWIVRIGETTLCTGMQTPAMDNCDSSSPSVGSGQQLLGLDVDNSGDIVVTGQYTGNIRIGSLNANTATAANDNDIFVARISTAGAPVWLQRFAGETLTVNQAGIAIAVDRTGTLAGGTGVYITGDYTGDLKFGANPTLTTCSGASCAYVARLSGSTGDPVWSRGAGDGTNRTRGRGVTFVPTGSTVAIVGDMRGTANFGGSTLTSAGSDDVFVARFNAATGAHVSSTRAGDGGSQIAHAIATWGQNVYVMGYMEGTMNWREVGGGSAANCPVVTSNGASDTFLVSLAQNGSCTRSRSFGDANDQFGQAMAVVSPGNVFFTGHFETTGVWGGPTVTSNGARDAMVVSLNANWAHRYTRSFGSAGLDIGYGIAVDSSGNAFVTGLISGSVNVGNGAFGPGAGGTQDVFLIRYVP